MNCRCADAVEDADERSVELSFVNQADDHVVGRAEDGQNQLKQGEPAGCLRADR